jgi:hypothetical protein
MSLNGSDWPLLFIDFAQVKNYKFLVRFHIITTLFQKHYMNITHDMRMDAKKRPYRAPRLVRAGSFEELVRAAKSWDELLIFGLNGGAAGENAAS